MPFRQPKLPALEHEFPWGKRHRRSYPLAPLRPASGTAPTVANMCLDFFTVYGLFIIFLHEFKKNLFARPKTLFGSIK